MKASILPAAIWLLAAAPTLAAGFDKPLSTERIPIASGGASGGKAALSCFYFRGLRVKQLDLGEVGAAELAILPLAGGAKPPCRRSASPGEIVIPSKEWSGYFKGVRSGYVFFDAEDGTNGGLGFAVFDGRTGKKLFEDLAVGALRTAKTSAGAIRVRYRRVFAGSCSVPQAGAKCWAEMAAGMPGVRTAPPPDCRAGYAKAKAAMAKGRCEARQKPSPGCFAAEMKRLDEQRWNEAPSVVAYDVEAEIGRSRQSMRALGGVLSCWPAD